MRSVNAETDGVCLHVRPLRIAPPFDVVLNAGHVADGKLHCPLKVEKHLHWLLRHIIPLSADPHVTINDHKLVIDVEGLLQSRLPGINLVGIEKQDGGIVAEFSVTELHAL